MMVSEKDGRLALLEEKDLSAVAQLEKLCFSEPWSAESLAILTREGGFGVGLWLDGRLLAYGGMTTVLDEGSVTNIASHPAFRRKGYGRRVLRALLREAEERGITAVFLEVRESNLAAGSLYESEDFVAVGVRKNFYRLPTESAIQMVRRANQTNE